MGYGIGSGIIIDRQPFYGANGYAGEIGHIVVAHQSNTKGREGIYGTLEALASGYGITDIIKAKMEAGESSILRDQIGTISTKLVMEAAIKGDALSVEIIDAAAEYIGISIDTLIKLFNPEAITLSGGLGESGSFFTNKIKDKVTSIGLQIHKQQVPISPSSFGEDAALMGAFSLILQHILKL